MWKCRHSSAIKKGCWIQGNKIGKCLLTPCIPRSVTGAYHNVPGSEGTREGRCLLTNTLREPHCLAYPAGATSEPSSSERKTSPLQWERRNFKISGVYCSVSPQASYNNTIEFLLGSLDGYHSFTYHWALRKHRFSLPQVSAIWNWLERDNTTSLKKRWGKFFLDM